MLWACLVSWQVLCSDQHNTWRREQKQNIFSSSGELPDHSGLTKLKAQC